MVAPTTTTNPDGLISVFVTVDRDLDPAGDGYPNRIVIAQ
jgi:hypothetical protein